MKREREKFKPILATALLIFSSLVLSSCSSSTKEVFISDCGYGTAQRPEQITLACADAGMMVTGATWSTWGSTNAFGRGTYEYNDCTPTCVAGKFHKVAVSVMLSKPVRDSKGRELLFSYITIKSKDGSALNTGGSEYSTTLLDFSSEATNTPEEGGSDN